MFGIAVFVFAVALVLTVVSVFAGRAAGAIGQRAQERLRRLEEEMRRAGSVTEEMRIRNQIEALQQRVLSKGLGKYLWAATGVVYLAFAVFMVLSTMRTVPAGHVGVLDFFGAVDQQELPSGLHFWINPLKTLTTFSTRTEVYAATGGDKALEINAKVYQDDAINVLSEDGLRVRVDVAVWFKVIGADANRIYKTIGTDYVDKIVKQNTRAAVRDATAKYKATDLYQEARSQLAVDIQTLVRQEFLKRGIDCEKAALRDIELPPMVADAIQQKLQAQQEAQKMEFKLQKEEKEADRKRIEARGIKDAQEIINETLSSAYLSYYYIETLKNLVNSPNNTILILPMDQKLTPLINVTGNPVKLRPPPVTEP